MDRKIRSKGLRKHTLIAWTTYPYKNMDHLQSAQKKKKKKKTETETTVDHLENLARREGGKTHLYLQLKHNKYSLFALISTARRASTELLVTKLRVGSSPVTNSVEQKSKTDP